MSTKQLPIGLSSLQKMVDQHCVYIDKTRFVTLLAESGSYYFLSRPRRFGKSLFVDTLNQAFDGQRELFTGLYLEKHWDWSVRHPVIRFGFSASSAHNSKKALLEIISQKIRHCMSLYDVQVNLDQEPGSVLTDLVIALYDKYQVGVVVLVDEYDKPILDVLQDKPLATANREILKGLYSGLKELDSYLKLVFLTGVSKFSKVNLFSGLNNLYDLSLDARYADLCGYTQAELEHSFHDRLEGVDKKQLKAWYNGYNFAGADKQKVYNPFDILLFFQNNKRYKNYWFETATPSFLIHLLQKHRYYLPSLEKVIVPENDLATFDIDEIPFVTLAFQTGYLTIKRVFEDLAGETFELTYPNKEVKTSFNSHIAAIGSSNEVRNDNIRSMYAAIEAQNIQALKAIIHAFFASIPNDWYRKNHINEYEGFYCSIVYSYFCAAGYQVIGEDITNKGKIDLTIKAPNCILIFEFKLANTAETAQDALMQIKTKSYAEKYKADNKPIYMIGMALEPEQRNLLGFEWACYSGDGHEI